MPGACCELRTAGVTIAGLDKHLGQQSSASSIDADERSSRVFLAFLLDGQGKAELAESHWSALTAKAKLNAAQSPPTPAANDPGTDRELISQQATAPDR